MLSCVRASCLEETSHTTEARMPNKTLGWHYDVGIMPLPAFTPRGLCQPFINALFGMSLAQQCLLRFRFKYPLQMWTPSKILNDPNDAFQIVSSHIIFRGNLDYVLSTPLATDGGGGHWKVICTASFYFIVAHYSRFCSLISASSSLAMRGGKK